LLEQARDAGKLELWAVNTSFRAARCDLIYGADRRWWSEYRTETEGVRQRWTQDTWAATAYGLNFIKVRPDRKGLSRDRRFVVSGKNSGYQAIGLAYHFRHSRIILVGYDMKNAGKHWHGDHPKGWGNSDNCGSWVNGYGELAEELKKEGIEVLNCTIDTALKCFKQMPLEEALDGL